MISAAWPPPLGVGIALLVKGTQYYCVGRGMDWRNLCCCNLARISFSLSHPTTHSLSLPIDASVFSYNGNDSIVEATLLKTNIEGSAFN